MCRSLVVEGNYTEVSSVFFHSERQEIHIIGLFGAVVAGVVEGVSLNVVPLLCPVCLGAF